MSALRHARLFRNGRNQTVRTISPNGLFIAAHALSLDLTLVTHNMRVSSRVPGLKAEDWLA